MSAGNLRQVIFPWLLDATIRNQNGSDKVINVCVRQIFVSDKIFSGGRQMFAFVWHNKQIFATQMSESTSDGKMPVSDKTFSVCLFTSVISQTNVWAWVRLQIDIYLMSALQPDISLKQKQTAWSKCLAEADIYLSQHRYLFYAENGFLWNRHLSNAVICLSDVWGRLFDACDRHRHLSAAEKHCVWNSNLSVWYLLCHVVPSGR